MTPQQFCEMVEPHLPIGPIVHVAAAGGFSVFVGCNAEIGAPPTGESITTRQAARLLLGAVVEEWAWVRFCACTGTVDCEVSDDGDQEAEERADGTDIFAKLRAALSARSAARGSA